MVESAGNQALQRVLEDLRFTPIDLTQIEPSFGYLIGKASDNELVIGQIQNTLRDIGK